MTLLYLTPTGDFSGAERITLDIAKEMQARGHAVVYSGLRGNMEDYCREVGVPFMPLPSFTPKQVRIALRKVSPQVVHAMDYRASTYASFFSIPLIAHLHSNPPWLKTYSLNSWGMLWFGHRAKHIITVSSSVMEEAVFGGRLLRKTVIMPNTVDIAAVQKASGTATSMEYDLGFVGRLAQEKNPLGFLRLVNAIQRKNPETKAVLIGDGECRMSVESAIDTLGLRSTVTVAGFLENPFPTLSQCRVIVMPSLFEGFGLTAVESMALGRPVVACAVGGLKSIVDGSCGALCSTEDEMFNETLALLKDEALYQKKAQGAKKRAETFGRQADYYDQIEALYNESNHHV